MITPLLSSQKYYFSQKEVIYYVIVFHDLYEKGDCQKTLKYLDAETKKIIDPYTLYVSSPRKSLEKINNKAEITKYARGVIKDIAIIEEDTKIGAQLVQKIKEDSSFEEDLTVVINENSGLKIFKEVISRIEKIDPSIVITSQYPDLLMFTIKTKLENVEKIEAIPEVDKIFFRPLAAEHNSLPMGHIKIVDKQNISFLNESQNLSAICVIDTGVNFKSIGINSKENEDKFGHGTKVASLARFSNQLLKKKTELLPETRIISHRLIENGEYDLIKGLIEAIKQNKDCKVFCLSHNFITIDPLFRKVISERLDRFIQKQNVAVLNSCGNIDWNDVEINKEDFPKYISKFEVLAPAECRSILAVGNVMNKSNKTLPACNTRHGIGEIFVNKARDIFIYQKPEICFTGGYVDINSVRTCNDQILFDLEPDKAIPVINEQGDVVLDVGTSFSTPLIANAFCRLLKEYPTYKNIETFKAMLLNKCDYTLIQCDNMVESKPSFCLKDMEDIQYCKDSVFLQLEGTWKPSEQFETREKRPFVKGYEVSFYVPKKVGKMRVMILHSNDYPLQKIDEPAVSFVIKVLKPNGKGINSKYNTLAKPTHVNYGEYKLKEKDCDGLWKIQFKIWGYNVPKEMLDKINVRFGVSIRLFPRENEDIKEIYDLVKSEGKVEETHIEEELIKIETDKGEMAET